MNGCPSSPYGNGGFKLSQFQNPGPGYTLKLSDCAGTFSDETKPFTVVTLDCDSGQSDFCVTFPPPGYSALLTDYWHLNSLNVTTSRSFVGNNYAFNNGNGFDDTIKFKVDLYKSDGSFIITTHQPTEGTCCFGNECFDDTCNDLTPYWVNTGTFLPGLSTGEYYFVVSVADVPEWSLLSDKSAVFKAFGYNCDSLYLCIKSPAAIEGQTTNEVYHAGNTIWLEFGKAEDADDFSVEM